MKSRYISFALILTIIGFATGCAGDDFKAKPDISHAKKKELPETEMLYTFLEQSGNYINQKATPNTIAPYEVYANLKRWHVIDTRPHDDYVAGHIDGAVNVQLPDLIDYMNNKIEAGVFEKIIFVCHSGQKAGYAVSALRLLGYGNTYSMKWGMSSWDKNLAAEKWTKNSQSSYVSKLETTANSRAPKGEYPTVKTGKTLGYDILEARATEILKNSDFLVKIEDVMGDPTKYYIINYWKTEDYAKGHLTGAIVYPPKESFTRNTLLNTLPTNKPILVYCNTGHHAAYVVAYLRILGYDAYSLSYGANAFMQSLLKESGHAFGPEQIKNFPLIEGESPSLVPTGGTETESNEHVLPEKSPTPSKVTVKKEESGGC